MNDARFEELMVKVTDGAATVAEREELMAWLVDKPDLRHELESHQALSAVTDGWMRRLEADLAEDRLAASTPGRAAGGLGILLLIVGIVVLSLAGPILAMQDPEVPLGIKLGTGLSLGGGLLLLLTVVLGRLRAAKNDPYTEVIR